LRGEQVGENPLERAINGIQIPEVSADYSGWVEILAIGPRVGLECSKKHAEKHGTLRRDGKIQPRPLRIANILKVGDIAWCDKAKVNSEAHVKWNTLDESETEYFIEESVLALCSTQPET